MNLYFFRKPNADSRVSKYGNFGAAFSVESLSEIAKKKPDSRYSPPLPIFAIEKEEKLESPEDAQVELLLLDDDRVEFLIK